MEEVKKDEIQKEKNLEKSSKKRNIIICVIGIISIITIGLGAYFIFNHNNDIKTDGKDQIKKCESILRYNKKYSKSGKEITLKYREYNNDTGVRTYDLEVNGEKSAVFGINNYIADFTFMVSNDNVWYLLNDCDNKIISYYETNNGTLSYEIEKTKNGKIVIVYSYDKQGNEKIVLIANANKEIIRFDETYPKDVVVREDSILLIFDNKIIQYDIDGTIMGTKIFDKLIFHNIGSYVFVKKNDSYYKITLDNFNENKVEKTTYQGGNKTIDIYDMSYYNEYCAYYNGEMILMGVDEYNNDENYAYYYGGGGQCAEHNFLVNKKTKKIEKYDNVGLGFIKTKNGYYFTRDNSECSLEHTTSVYTTDWKLLGIRLDYKEDVDSQGNVYLRDKSDIVKYDINGKELLRNSNYKEIGSGIVVEDILYVIVKDENDIIYLLNLKDNSKFEITQNGDNFELWLEISIGVIDDNSGLSIVYYDWDSDKEINFKYDFSTKKLEKVKE